MGLIKSTEFLQKTDFLSNIFFLSECILAIIYDNIEIYIRNKEIQEKVCCIYIIISDFLFSFLTRKNILKSKN